MVHCAVRGCKSSNKKSKTEPNKIPKFFIPRNKILRDKWVLACNRLKQFNADNARVCSLHFQEFDFKIQPVAIDGKPSRKQLLNTAVPNINLPYLSIEENSRLIRSKVRQRKKLVDEILRQAEFEEDSRININQEVHISLNAKYHNNNNDVKIIGNNMFKEIKILQISGSSQTDVDMSCEKESHILHLEKQCGRLKRIVAKQKKELDDAKNLKISIKKILTKGQLKKLSYYVRKKLNGC